MVCSLHFDEQDYVTETQDTNKARAKRKSGLKYRILSKEAWERGPIRFPNCPSYLSSQKPQSRSGQATSSSRFSREFDQMEATAESILDQDRIESIEVTAVI